MSESVAIMQCDECGLEMTTAHRIYKDRRYCATCYARVFKRRMCPKCGNYARLPKNDANAICSKCEIDKPCIRCGKTEYAVGKVTPYGPVCSSCAPYFREMRPCQICDKPSHRLTRVKRLGIDVPVCPKCARSDHGTCSACHRPRLLQEGPDGKLLCKACLEQGEIQCPACNKPMPAGRGRLCETCYWKEAFGKRLKINQESLSMPEIQKAFGEFGEWLLAEVGEHKAALTLHRYMPFFVEIEMRWGSIQGYASLLNHFGAEGLRRVRLPMHWLKDNKNVVPDVAAREADSDRRRIDAIVASIPKETPAAKALTTYQGKLMKRVNAGKSTLRSVRLALRPAASLLLEASPDGEKMPDQTALDRYLLAVPGQIATITGFINYLNEKHGLSLVPKVNELLVSEVRRKKLEVELMALVREGGEGEDFRRRWLSVALAYFHGLPRRVGSNPLSTKISAQEDGSFNVVWNNQVYWVPQCNMYSAQLRVDKRRG
jgi:hypothetical protein